MQKFTDRVRKSSDIILILILGLVLRLRLIARDDLWFDEAFTGYLMKVPKKLFLEELAKDAHPTLYAYITKAWTTVLGVNDFTLRLLPLVCGILIILFAYLVAKKLFDKETATVAALFLAVSPFLVGYSVEARSYSFFGFIAILAVYLLILKKELLFIAALAILLKMHHMAILFTPVPLLYYGYLLLTRKVDWKKGIPVLILCGALVFLTYNQLIHRETTGLNLEWVRPASYTHIPRSIAAYLFGVKVRLGGEDSLNNLNFFVSELTLSGLFFGIYTITTLLLLYKNRKDEKSLTKNLFIIFMFLIPQLILIFYSKQKEMNIYVERYLFPAAIFFLISLAHALTKTFNFETTAMLVLFYLFTLTKIQKPDYYIGMKDLSYNFMDTTTEVVFTSPTDFLIGKYYFSLRNNENRVRLYDPQNPDSDYEWWPFVSTTDKPQSLETAIVITPDETRMTEEFKSLADEMTFGNYKVFIKN